ncbi:transcriptional regulator Cro/CI family (plasmid) [Allorhizobium ampelinum S4]|uniref:Transcriptional regulator Cro/CI family n=1 Tax=Allorhizobium ampelinum (strain ATCC BAA-846 / DSM 112012 / S4) TaxID=311402 RepID=B9K336_ALLAM|nr:helix-turn-helix transcriptional regulator [Allorhizobium ampelinum]ACM39284.1 transcriptional regulator Cro/CI family [Allorhizobium ampelinum S4]
MKDEPHAVDVAVGRAIRKRRMINGVSQSDLGARIGVTFQQVQKYEKGTNRVSASMLMEIACALHVDVRSFFDGIDAPSGKEPLHHTATPAAFSITRETVALNQAFAQINDALLRRKIVDLVRAVASSSSTSEDELLHDLAE